MSKKTAEQLAVEQLNKYLAGKTEKDLKESDRRSTNPDWHINVSESNRKKHANPEIRAKIIAGNQNRKERLGIEYSKRMSEAQRRRYENMSDEERDQMSKTGKEVWQNTEYRERMRAFYSSPEQVEKHTKQVREVALRKDWREKVSKLNKDKRKDPTHIEKHQAAVDKRTQDPEWRLKQAERAKPMITPDGIFKSRKEAAEFYQVKTPVMNSRMKKYPSEYFYISREEYIMLTGKDII